MRSARYSMWKAIFGCREHGGSFVKSRAALLWCLAIGGVTYLAYSPKSAHVATRDDSSEIVGSSNWARGRRLLQSASNSANYTDNIFYNPDCSVIRRNVSAHAVPWEDCSYERSVGWLGAWIAFYGILTILIFIALAIVCDEFFVPSLEAISEKLHLSEDVAGATFMAAGSSAPELFSSIAAVSFESDVGVGTICGSAVFNLLVIISLTAAFAGQILRLDWRPLIRDAVFYFISVTWFIYSAWDTFFQIWEVIGMLLLYSVYIAIMVYNEKLMDWMEAIAARFTKPPSKPSQPLCEEEVSLACESKNTHDEPNGEIRPQRERRISMVGGHARRLSLLSHTSCTSGDSRLYKHDRRNSLVNSITGSHHSLSTEEKLDVPARKKSSVKHSIIRSAEMSNLKSLREEESPIREIDEDATEEVELNQHNKALSVSFSRDNNDDRRTSLLSKSDTAEEKEPSASSGVACCFSWCPVIRGSPPTLPDQSCSSKLVFGLKWIIFVCAFPFICLFSWTVPDCSTPKNRHWFPLSFLTSVGWIASLSFAMVTVVARTGCLVRVDSYVMSLVVLAAGTSIPDLMSSIIVARDGFGDMAVSNAIGSNVFDIDLGLGLPFLIRMIFELGKPFDIFSQTERAAYCTNQMLIMPHVKFGFILLFLLATAMVVFVCAKFRLNKPTGISFFFLYLIFLAYAFIQEFKCNKSGKYNC